MAIGDIIVGLDVGTSKVGAVVGQVNKFSEIEVIGYGMAASSGIKKGIIVDPQTTSMAIREAIKQAEEISGLAINSAYINIKGMDVRIEKVTMESDVANPDDGLKISDIQNLYSNIQITTKLEEKEQLIDIIPSEYIINSRSYKEEPIGAFCKKVTVKADVVIAKGEFIDSLMETLKISKLNLDGLVLETLATSNVVLMPEEKEIGVLMVDVGAGHTDISVYKSGEIEYYSTIPVGGDHITNDIAIVLDISTEEAEKLKRQYNLAIQAMITNNHEIKLTTRPVGKEEEQLVKCSDIVKIIEERIKEIYSIIKKKISECNLFGKIECMVITGQGISNIVGVEELAVLNLKINQVRICSPKLINVIKPQHTTAYGMVRYISTLGFGKHVNSDVEIITDSTFKDKISDIIYGIKEKAKNLFNKSKEK